MLTTIDQVEKDIEANKVRVALANKVQKLMNNREFKEVILEGFCKEDCARNAQISTDSRLSDLDRADALGNAQAPGYLIRFLKFTEAQGRIAAQSIEGAEVELEEMRREELPE